MSSSQRTLCDIFKANRAAHLNPRVPQEAIPPLYRLKEDLSVKSWVS